MSDILFFDTETTGIPLWRERSDGEGQPHLVQVAGLRVNADSREIMSTLDVIVSPTDWEIPQATIDVHGITQDHAEKFGIPEGDAIQMLLDMDRACSKRVAHNTTFDNRIARIAFKRWANDEAVEEWKAGSYECTMQLSKPVMGIKKNPRLAEAYKFFFGEEHPGQHSAMCDAIACMDIYFAIKDRQ